jgi:hypothetical protein
MPLQNTFGCGFAALRYPLPGAVIPAFAGMTSVLKGIPIQTNPLPTNPVGCGDCALVLPEVC